MDAAFGEGNVREDVIIWPFITSTAYVSMLAFAQPCVFRKLNVDLNDDDLGITCLWLTQEDESVCS